MRITYLPNALNRKEEIDLFLSDWNSTETHIQLQSSGSTGKPKKFRVEKPFLVASARMTNRFFNLDSSKSLFLCLNTSSIAGKMMIIRALLADAHLLVGPVSSTPLVESEEHIDFAAMVPMQVEESIKTTPEKFNLVKNIIIGGAPINSSLWHQISTLETACFQTFGMTETYSHIALRQITLEKLPYTLLSGVEMEKSDHLVINAPQLGVFNLKTTDCIRYIDSRHFEWIGREDFVINSGGLKLHPEELEFKMSQLIPLPFFSTGMADEKLGEKHVLMIEGKLELNKSDFQKILRAAETPKEIYFFEKFHYTSSNKIDRLNTKSAVQHAIRQVL